MSPGHLETFQGGGERLREFFNSRLNRKWDGGDSCDGRCNGFRIVTVGKGIMCRGPYRRPVSGDFTRGGK